ncbi:MAG: SurA N-terminal domain-containing protein [Gammaproteobacteria bacterium]
MLIAIRDRVSGWIAYVIVVLISLTFALWGIDQYFGGADERVAAEVNGVDIPMDAFSYQFQQERSYLQQAYDGELPAGQTDAMLKQVVIQGMARAEVLQQETQSAGYRVSDAVLLNELGGMQVFHADGQFDPQRYEQLLQAQQQTKAGFEDNLRSQIGLSYFEDGINRSAFLPPVTREQLLSLKNQRRSVEYFTIPAEPEEVKVSDEAITDYYQANRQHFQSPERVRLAYIDLSEQARTRSLDVNENALRAFYRSQTELYADPEQRRARHILIKSSGGGKDADAALKRASELAARARQGEDFARLAEVYSEDALSAPVGGDLGFIARGDMDASLEDALFALDKGETSDPVKTSLGYQVVQLADIKPARSEPFTQVRDQVDRAYRRENAKEAFIERAEQLVTVSYEQSASLQPAAEALGLKVRESGWITRAQGSGIGADQKIRDAAFQDDVLKGGRNSDMIELSPGRAVVARVIDHQPAKVQPLAAVRDDIEQILSVRTVRRQATQAGKQALAVLRDGKSMAEVARRSDLEPQALTAIQRTDRSLPQPVVEKLFALDKPAAGNPTYGGVPLAEGFAIIALVDVQAGDAIKAAASEGSASDPDARYGERERDAVYRALEAGAEIRIMQENL